MKRYLLLLLLTTPALAQTVDLKLTAGTTAGNVIPTLTWSTTPAATSCTASGDTGWAAVPAKAASGTQTLGPALPPTSKAYTLTCVYSGGDTKAVLTWATPTTNVDGTVLTDLGGYRIQYGNSASSLDTSVYLQDPVAKTWTSPVLAAGTWYFSLRAFNTLGIEGPPSEQTASTRKTISAGGTATATATLSFPGTTIVVVK